ncbi:MAG: response regulator [Marinifilaceae bacterium]
MNKTDFFPGTSMQTVKILIIEDDRVDALTQKRALKDSGYDADITYVENGTDGLKALENQQYDCIFLDFQLPDLDGMQFIKEIQRRGIEAPVIVVTSHGDEKIAAQTMKAGATDYIPKSLLTPEGLSQSLRNALWSKENEIQRRNTEKKLRMSQERLMEAQRLARIGNMEVNVKSEEIIWSEEACRIFGLSCKDKASYRQYLKTIHSDDINLLVKKINEAILNQQSYNIDYRIVLPSGEIRYINDNGYPIEDENGMVYRLICTVQDITERKLIEKQLIEAKEIAEKMVNSKQQFIANISHEIRTPMNGILGLTNILHSMEEDQEKKGYLDAIRKSAENLVVIINDLLDVSKIEAGKLKFEETPFDLNELLDSNFALFQQNVRDKNIRVHYKVDPMVQPKLIGDPVKLLQVINNLVGNAIKFTQNGEVFLKIDLKKNSETEQEIAFAIKDTGIGIPSEKLETIFDSFAQASSDIARKFGGTGLGLTICRNIIELQGGKLEVESVVNQGSTFSFTLSFRKQRSSMNRDEINFDRKEVSERGWSAYRVLLVEDNKINQILAKKLITDWGFQYDWAENGKQAIEKVKKGPYDLILMDLQMPEMDGYQATEVLRNQMQCTLPVVALTANAQREEKDCCLEKGFNDFITKPFKSKELFEKITFWINKTSTIEVTGN